MAPRCTIRRLQPADVALFQALRRRALTEHPLAFLSSPQDDRSNDTQDQVRQLQQPERFAIFGACDAAGTLVGMVGLIRQPQAKSAHRAMIWGMYVAPEARRLGAGRALMQAALAHVRTWPGVTRVTLCVTDAAPEARALYLSLGFQWWGAEADCIRWEGRTVADHHMVLDLRPQPAPPALPTGVALRSATPADAAAFCHIYNPFIVDSVVSFELTPVTPADMTERIQRTQAEYPWLVLEDRQGVVGYAYASRWRTRAAYNATAESTIYMRPDARGTGLAYALYHALLDRMRAQGLQQAIGGISLPNPQSERFHEKCGFVKVAHFPRVGFKCGRWVDVGFWQRSLCTSDAQSPRKMAE